MKIKLPADLADSITPQIRLGFILIGRVYREEFDAGLQNADTAGSLWFEFGAVPAHALPALREAIRKATATPAIRHRTA